MRHWVAALLILVVSPLAVPARAAEPVDVALVLVTDVSRSIDDGEFDLEKNGYAAAFRDRDVLTAIQSGAIGAIAVSYVEFAGEYENRVVVDWTVIKDAASAAAFTNKMLAAKRSYYGRTAIGSGVDLAVKTLAAINFETQRKIIDVCGDGTNNAGADVDASRDAAVAAGITINGLAIINDHPMNYTFAHTQPPGGLAKYYRENVAGGTGTFVREVHDFHDFGAAMTRKLIDEIAALQPAPGPARL